MIRTAEKGIKMKKLFILGLVFLCVGTVAWAVNDVEDRDGSWRYKMIVEVETPEGVKSGSSVREVTTSTKTVYYEWVNETNTTFRIDVKGEAVVVDLGSRGKVFALLNGYAIHADHAKLISSHVFYNSNKNNLSEYMSNLKDAKAILEPYQYPVLMTFSDLNDPKSVVPLLEVERGKFLTDLTIKQDHFEKHFGEGVRLKAISIEMTEEPLAWGMVDRFLPDNFKKEITDKWMELSMEERRRIRELIYFKTGEQK